MTNKSRSKDCLFCRKSFKESNNESNVQWEGRMFCSKVCSNRSIKPKSIFDRLEKYQIKGEFEDDCWKWIGTKDGAGYGKLSSRRGRAGSPERAHRVSYEKKHGEIPTGMFVCHKCDNPECTNPRHLFVGTAKDNLVDCSKKNRLNKISLKNLRPGRKGFRGSGPIKIKEEANVE